MNLLFWNTYPAWGGGETWMLDIASGLRARGHRCLIAGRRGQPWFERAREQRWEPVELNVRGEFAPFQALRLRHLFRRAAIDLVLCNFYKEVRVSAAARFPGRRPRVVNLKGLPLISDTFRHRFGYRHVIDHTVVCAEFIRREFLARPWIDPRRLSVIYNCYRPSPVPVGTRSIREEYAIPPDHAVVGAVARFDPRKGLQDLIAAIPLILSSHPRTTFVIVGDGADREHLMDLVAQSGFRDRVIATGFRHDLDPVFMGLDVFVLPSHAEGFPYVTQIAMHHGVAVVATRVGGVPDAIEDGVNGLLVEPRSPGELAAAINGLLADPPLRARLGREGQATLRERFSYEGMIDRFEGLFRELVGGAGS
jgi:glycosyltransferase involved in cell wall biosynthesis